MNIPTKYILLAGLGAAYLIFKKNNSLAAELEILRKQMNDGDIEIIDIVNEKTKTKDQLIKNSLKIEPRISIGEFEGAKWSFRVVWKITNLSTQYTFVVTGIKSVVTLDGYTMRRIIPGNTSTFLTLRPGKSGEMDFARSTVLMFEDWNARKAITDRYWQSALTSPQKGVTFDTNIRVQSVYGETIVVDMGMQEGTLKHEGHYFGNYGADMVNSEL